MKNLKRNLGVVLVIVAVACASAPPKAAYDVLGIAAVAVNTGMAIFADRVVAGTVPQALQDTVRKDFGTYQIVMADAKKAVDAWFAAGAVPALYPTAPVAKALSAASSLQAEVK